MTIVIDGTTFNVGVESVEETCDFLDKYAERTADGVLRRELIGTYWNQRIKFGRGPDEAALWVKLSEAVEFHIVTIPDADGVDFTFTAYFSQLKRSLRKYYSGSKTYWRDMSVSFIAQSPKATP